ncbi:Cache sensor hybrid histidine kinase [Aneurinibacillus soli]|uniref:histidine kinase n=1 Tax=Aneurinibacillus soli TaxID=1500254 RepID=A0A0U4WJX6_9BACL|nr:ATP-binding protein [Aneurinibacillus soli]PYE63133.1 Cache sensor hybrid histidine kinase [Aneurinibacillus soli]BAU28809.1 Aerobic respiration control sensor protein ArcB [Aneurinibacillus soli]
MKSWFISARRSKGSKQDPPIPLFRWIWKSYIRTALIPLVLVELLFVGLYFLSGIWTKEQTIIHSKKNADEELQRIAHREANRMEQQLSGIESLGDVLHRQIEYRLAEPAPSLSADDASRLVQQPNGSYYTVRDRADGGGVAVFYSGHTPVTDTGKQKVAQLLQLQPLFKHVQKSQPMLTWVYYTDHDSLAVLYPYLDVRKRFQYGMDFTSHSFYYEADQKHNPQRHVRWTNTYLDLAGKGWMTSCLFPVYYRDRLEGVVGLDVTLNTISRYVLNLDIPWDGYGMLLGRDGAVLALSDRGVKDWEKAGTSAPSYSFLQDHPDFPVVRKLVQAEKSGITHVDINGKNRLLAWETIPGTGWRLLIYTPEQSIYMEANRLGSELMQVGMWMLAGLFVFYVGFFIRQYYQAGQMSSRLLHPLTRMNDMVRRIGQGKYRQESAGSEIAELHDAEQLIAGMGERLGEARHELEEREQDLQALLQSIDDIIFEIDEDGVYVNVWTHWMKYEEIIGKKLTDRIGEEPGRVMQEAVLRVLTSGQPEVLEQELTVPWGRRWFQTRIAPVFNRTGMKRTVSALVRDITEKKQMEQLLILAREEAEKASLAKSQFLSSMSHELRTPMNAILGFAQLLEYHPHETLTSSQQQSVEEILKAGNHLLDLIDDVLDLARIEAGKTSIMLEPVDVDLLLQECTALIAPLADRRSITCTIRYELSPELAVVMADRIRLKQILLNLLSNAVKYNQDGGLITVSVEEPQPDWVRITVSDTGCGITDVQKSVIFESFQRGEQEGIEGTGIGLTIARQLARLMNGDVQVRSTPGVGSDFWIDLCRCESVSLKHVNANEAKLPRNRSHVHLPLRKVLYIEDNSANLMLISRVLSRYPDVEVLCASDAELGMELAQVHEPHVILLDLHLPGMNGYEALRRLRAYPNTKHIPVVAISAHAMPREVARGKAAGFAEYITKPLHLPDFLTTMEKLLGIETKQ